MKKLYLVGNPIRVDYATDKEVLSCIAKLVGNPIRVDYATDKLTRARYARVCIEVHLDKPLITKVWVGGNWQMIVYKNIDTLCFECGIIGHIKQNCLNNKHLHGVQHNHDTNNNNSENITPTQQSPNMETTPSYRINNERTLEHTEEHSYGPWTLVTNRRTTKQRSDNYNGKLMGVASNNSRINDYGKKTNSTANKSKPNTILTHKTDKNLSSSPIAQSKFPLLSTNNNFAALNTEANLLSTLTRNENEENSSSQHVVRGSKQLDAPTLVSPTLDLSPSFSKKSLSIQKASEKHPHSSSSPVVGSITEITDQGKQNTSDNYLSKETSRNQETERLLQDSSEHSGDITGGSVGIELIQNSESVPNFSDIDMHDKEDSTGNAGGTLKRPKNSQLSQLQRPTLHRSKCDQESELGEGPKLADCGGAKAELGQQELGIWTTNSSTGDKSTTPISSSKRSPNRSFAVRNSRTRYGSHRTPYSHVHHQGGSGGGPNSGEILESCAKSETDLHLSHADQSGGHSIDMQTPILEGLGELLGPLPSRPN
ncbi:uncharacterized protein [Spinacia oleracea]|uniref:CCHC-type domain-containing protein n=1 Tax=Spinacia oleracea TaxID=3562 RepID=A0ABM3R430_SPIOL|nr:uncharacterized protein LOC130465567 [Spinacia oleracea]